MATITERIDGLDGAIGCHFHRDKQQLFFVEFGGKLSRLDLIRPGARTVSSGETTLKGTYTFDLDTGTQAKTGENPSSMDIWWRQKNDTERQMEPIHGAQIANMGMVPFSRVSSADVQAQSFSTDPIIGNATGTNDLAKGDVFAVLTTEGNIAKVEVVKYGYNMRIRWRTYQVDPAYQVLGMGYHQPEDVVLSSDGRTAYITERTGNLLVVDPEDADRSEAVVLVSGLAAPHQIVLDEARSQVFVVEYASNGRLLRIDLTTGSTTTMLSGLVNAVGLAVTSDGNTAFVTEQGSGGPGAGRLLEIDLIEGRRDVVMDGLDAPFFLQWADAAEDTLFLTERDPTNRIVAVDLADNTIATVADGVPFRPSSVAAIDPYTILACSDDVISEIDVVDGLFGVDAPMILGVGRVPVSYIEQDPASPAVGTATTAGTGIGIQVQQAPFGATLPIKINHDAALDAGARFYRLFVVDASGTEIEPRQAWRDYKWNTSTDRFEPETLTAMSGGYYRVRRPHELWYDHWLGYGLNTGILPNGPVTVRVEFYADRVATSRLDALTENLVLSIDNGWPRAHIDAIRHYLPSGGTEVVDACSIVTTRTDDFDFEITANDPQGHLKSLTLRAFWGDNRTALVHREVYDPAIKGHTWEGPINGITPRWDAEERHCAHTFRLDVWDRVINGNHHLHHAVHRRSITLLVPGSD